MRVRWLGAGLLGAALLSGAASVPAAFASSAPPQRSFEVTQARLVGQLVRRQATLASLRVTVAQDPHLSAAHGAILDARLASETASINGLLAKVEQDTTAGQLRADASTMFRDDRVYKVMVPQVRVATAADDLSATASSLAAREVPVGSALAVRSSLRASAPARRAYGSYVAATGRAEAALAGLADGVLALVPQDYPHTNAVIDAARGRLADARAAIGVASAALSRVESFLSRRS